MSKAPLAIAHRAGNDRAALNAALGAGADVAEADIWPHRGRFEVRHLKTMGRVPLLWDRWKLVSARAPRLLMPELLAEWPTGIGVMLDLKGHDTGAAAGIAGAVAELDTRTPVYVCARDWGMLAPFRDTGAMVVHSAGKGWELERLYDLVDKREVSAVSIHEALLTRPLVERLRGSIDLLMSWPVNRLPRLRALTSWGVNGIITDDLAIVRHMHEEARARGEG